MPKIQKNTFVALKTPLGPEALLIESLSGVEGVSRLFHFDLDLLSEDPDIDYSKIVGQPVTVSLDLDGIQAPRYLHGHLNRFQQLRNRNGLARYRAELVPWLWFLTQTTDCRIFQHKRVHEIIEEVCSDNGHHDIRSELNATYEEIEYCVQYRETDFAFLSRLMEHFGISYYFEHKKDKHTLVLVDSLAKFPECPGQKVARYKEDERVVDHAADPGVVTDLRLRQEVRPGKYTHRDYNFERPQNPIESASKGTIKVSHPAYEIYDHPGKYLVRDEGESLARLRMQALEAKYLLISGTSSCRPFLAGYTFELTEHPRKDANNKYLLLEVTHDLCAGGYTDAPPRYKNQFSCIPIKDPGMVPLRPARVTPWPRVEGPQTALVVGEAGEEIYTDKHGRIKVKFHWDRDGKRNEKSSCWVRVSQGWAGKGFGAIFLPRIGQEVIVDFLEGDPDQPIVTGAVYNAQQTPPYELPKDRTKSTVKTNSYKGAGFNEFRFEDKAGQEEIFLHAQKDLNETVGHNHSTTVQANQTASAGANQSYSAGANQSLSAGANQTVTVEKNQTLTVNIGDCTTNVTLGNYTLTAKQGVELTSGTDIFSATASKQVSIQSKTAGVGLTAKTLLAGDAGEKITLTAPDIKIGDKQILVDGTEITIQGKTSITLQVGSSSICLEPSGITISATKITSAATGVHEISGAVVKIN